MRLNYLIPIAIIAFINPALASQADKEILSESPDYALILEVNRQVNKELTYLSDLENYGVDDLHVIEPKKSWPPEKKERRKYADCEDYAMTKAYRLVKAGIPQSRLKVMMVQVPNQLDYHAVLVVNTQDDKQKLVLDNLDNRIYTKEKLMSRGITIANDWKFIRELPMPDLKKIHTLNIELDSNLKVAYSDK